MMDWLEYIIDSALDIFDAAGKGVEERNQEIVMKLLPLLLIGFIGVIFGIIWILEGGSS